jgi:hypothetical protein
VLTFGGGHQRFDAAIDRVRVPFDRSTSLEAIDEGREVGGVVVEAIGQAPHWHRLAPGRG